MVSGKLDQLQAWSLQDMFTRGPVFYVWGLFWLRVFQKEQIHDSLLYLLIKAINKPSFVDDSAEFGKEWIGSCVQKPKVIEQSISLSNNVFVKDQDTLDAAQDLCAWFVCQE